MQSQDLNLDLFLPKLGLFFHLLLLLIEDKAKMTKGFQLSPWEKTKVISFSFEMRLLGGDFACARRGLQETLSLRQNGRQSS